MPRLDRRRFPRRADALRLPKKGPGPCGPGLRRESARIRQAMPTCGYLTQVERVLTFGLGEIDRVDAVRSSGPTVRSRRSGTSRSMACGSSSRVGDQGGPARCYNLAMRYPETENRKPEPPEIERPKVLVLRVPRRRQKPRIGRLTVPRSERPGGETQTSPTEESRGR